MKGLAIDGAITRVLRWWPFYTLRSGALGDLVLCVVLLCVRLKHLEKSGKNIAFSIFVVGLDLACLLPHDAKERSLETRINGWVWKKILPSLRPIRRRLCMDMCLGAILEVIVVCEPSLAIGCWLGV